MWLISLVLRTTPARSAQAAPVIHQNHRLGGSSPVTARATSRCTLTLPWPSASPRPTALFFNARARQQLRLQANQRRTRGALASVSALLVLSFRPESRGWLFWKSRDAYSSQWLMTKLSSPVTPAFVPLIAEGLTIRSSLSDGAPTRTTMRWSLKLGKPLTIRRANSGGSEHPSPTSP